MTHFGETALPEVVTWLHSLFIVLIVVVIQLLSRV